MMRTLLRPLKLPSAPRSATTASSSSLSTSSSPSPSSPTTTSPVISAGQSAPSSRSPTTDSATTTVVPLPSSSSSSPGFASSSSSSAAAAPAAPAAPSSASSTSAAAVTRVPPDGAPMPGAHNSPKPPLGPATSAPIEADLGEYTWMRVRGITSTALSAILSAPSIPSPPAVPGSVLLRAFCLNDPSKPIQDRLAALPVPVAPDITTPSPTKADIQVSDTPTGLVATANDPRHLERLRNLLRDPALLPNAVSKIVLPPGTIVVGQVVAAQPRSTVHPNRPSTYVVKISSQISGLWKPRNGPEADAAGAAYNNTIPTIADNSHPVPESALNPPEETSRRTLFQVVPNARKVNYLSSIELCFAAGRRALVGLVPRDAPVRGTLAAKGNIEWDKGCADSSEDQAEWEQSVLPALSWSRDLYRLRVFTTRGGGLEEYKTALVDSASLADAALDAVKDNSVGSGVVAMPITSSSRVATLAVWLSGACWSSLDAWRACIHPTLVPGHHSWKRDKALGPVVDFLDASTEIDSEAVGAAARVLGPYHGLHRTGLTTEGGTFDGFVHRKIGSSLESPIVLSGGTLERPPVINDKVAIWYVKRGMHPDHCPRGGSYDGLDIPKEPGDYDICAVAQDAWIMFHRYHRADGTVKGVYANISMPVWVTRGCAEYLDLEVDVMQYMNPDGTPGEKKVVDSEDMARYTRWTGDIPPATEARIQEVISILLDPELDLGDDSNDVELFSRCKL